MHSSNTLRIPLLRRVFQYSRSLSWKKELHMFNWKDIRQISKSEKSKSILFNFSTFRFFEIQNEAFLLFDFSTFRNWSHSCTTRWTTMKKPTWIITRKRLKFTQGSEMISPNSFCGFVFTRPIDMILDPSFLQNPLYKHEEINLNYYSETVEFYTRF